MGFALWVKGDTAWAEGTHEYRPMGVAVIAITDLFHARDFRAGRRDELSSARAFAGFFASLGDLNDYLRRKRNDKPTGHPHHHGGVLSNT